MCRVGQVRYICTHFSARFWFTHCTITGRNNVAGRCEEKPINRDTAPCEVVDVHYKCTDCGGPTGKNLPGSLSVRQQSATWKNFYDTGTDAVVSATTTSKRARDEFESSIQRWIRDSGKYDRKDVPGNKDLKDLSKEEWETYGNAGYNSKAGNQVGSLYGKSTEPWGYNARPEHWVAPRSKDPRNLDVSPAPSNWDPVSPPAPSPEAEISAGPPATRASGSTSTTDNGKGRANNPTRISSQAGHEEILIAPDFEPDWVDPIKRRPAINPSPSTRLTVRDQSRGRQQPLSSYAVTQSSTEDNRRRPTPQQQSQSREGSQQRQAPISTSQIADQASIQDNRILPNQAQSPSHERARAATPVVTINPQDIFRNPAEEEMTRQANRRGAGSSNNDRNIGFVQIPEGPDPLSLLKGSKTFPVNLINNTEGRNPHSSTTTKSTSTSTKKTLSSSPNSKATGGNLQPKTTENVRQASTPRAAVVKDISLRSITRSQTEPITLKSGTFATNTTSGTAKRLPKPVTQQPNVSTQKASNLNTNAKSSNINPQPNTTDSKSKNTDLKSKNTDSKPQNTDSKPQNTSAANTSPRPSKPPSNTNRNPSNPSPSPSSSNAKSPPSAPSAAPKPPVPTPRPNPPVQTPRPTNTGGNSSSSGANAKSSVSTNKNSRNTGLKPPAVGPSTQPKTTPPKATGSGGSGGKKKDKNPKKKK